LLSCSAFYVIAGLFCICFDCHNLGGNIHAPLSFWNRRLRPLLFRDLSSFPRPRRSWCRRRHPHRHQPP
jgi:hypothetical protein